MPRVRYPIDNDVRLFTNRVLQTIRSVPGVTYAGGTTIIPLGGNHSDGVIIAEGYQMKAGESLVSPMQVVITPGYFEAMGTPLVRGRYFDERDNETGPGAVIVDERLAAASGPARMRSESECIEPTNPSDLLKPDENTSWLTVVGVIRDVQLEDLAGGPTTPVRTTSPAAQPVTRGHGRRDQDEPGSRSCPANDPQRSEEDRSGHAARECSNDDGIYGPVAHVAESRDAAGHIVCAWSRYFSRQSASMECWLTWSRSVRAKSASASHWEAPRAASSNLVLREGLWLVLSGLALGFVGAVVLRRTLRSQIYGLGALDPVVLAQRDPESDHHRRGCLLPSGPAGHESQPGGRPEPVTGWAR